MYMIGSFLLAHTPDEPRNNNSLPSSTATFTIQRNRGTFTSVSVTWNVTTPGSGADISPTMGVVTFEEGQQSVTFEIAALPDEVRCASVSEYAVYPCTQDFPFPQ